MEGDENIQQDKGERKRKLTVHVSFTEAQLHVLRNNAARTALSVSAYVRESCLKGKLSAGLDEEERFFFRQLVGISNDLHRLATQAGEERMVGAMLIFEQYRQVIDELIEQLKR